MRYANCNHTSINVKFKATIPQSIPTEPGLSALEVTGAVATATFLSYPMLDY